MMKKLCILLVATLCCFTQHVFAQIEIVGSDEYGRLFDITYDPNVQNKLYALTLGNHIVVSEDNGNNWDVLYAYPESGTSIDGLRYMDSNRLSFYVRNSLSSSTNRSLFIWDITTETVVQQYTAPFPDPNSDGEWVSSYSIYEDDTDVAVIHLGYRIGLVTTHNKVYYTDDSGKNWQEIYYNYDTQHYAIVPNNVAIHPNDPEKLYMARGNGSMGVTGGLLISEDAGTTWTEKIPGNAYNVITFNPADADDILLGTSIGYNNHEQNLYRSLDGGETWNIIPITWTDNTLDNITVITYNPSDLDHIIVLEENEIVITKDNFATWDNYVYPTGNIHSYYYGLNASFNPFNGDEVYISANYHPLFSNDGGETVTWAKNRFFVGMGNTYYFSNGSEEHLYYGVQYGYVHRDMNTLDENPYEIMPLNMVSLSPATTLKIDKNIAGRTYALSGSFMGHNLLVSNDHGENTTQVMNIFANQLRTVASFPNNPDIIWASFSNNNENPQLIEIDFSDPNNIQTSPITLPENDLVSEIYFDPLDTDHRMLAIGTWIYRTTDGGNTWINSSDGLEDLVPGHDLIITMTQNPLNESQFTLATSAGIFTSLDGGETWEEIYDSIVYNVAHSTETQGHILATVHNSDISSFKILYSTDGGEVWDEITEEDLDFLSTNYVFFSTTFKFYEEEAEVYITTSGLGLVKYTVELTTLNTPGFTQQSDFATIYPNPAANEINIYLQNGELKNASVFSVTGQKIMNAGNRTTIDISALNSGVYFISIETIDGKTTTKKVVKN